MKQFFAGAVAGLGVALVCFPVAYAAISAKDAKSLDRFADALERVQANYVHEVDIGELVDNAINGMLFGLDPHSSYMSAEAYAAMSTNKLAGIGLELTIKSGFPLVVSPIDGAPAALAGIQPGDYIVSIDGITVRDQSLDTVIAMMRGPQGSKVTLQILRNAAGPDIRTIAMTRAFFRVVGVHAMRYGAIGYIRITAFDNDTVDLLKRAVGDLKAQIGPQLKGYILDLRNNPGGLLTSGVEVSDLFLDSGAIVSLRGRSPSDNEAFNAHPGDITDAKPITVLINAGTASGAEIVAGALQQNHRATVIGMHTFGEGTIQTIIPLDGGGGGALRLTTAQFYLPDGKPIQVDGITPDVAVAQKPATDAEINNGVPVNEVGLLRHLPGSGTTVAAEPPVIYPDPTKQVGDFQLYYALTSMSAK